MLYVECNNPTPFHLLAVLLLMKPRTHLPLLPGHTASLYSRDAFHPVRPQPVLLCWILPTQMQGFTCTLVKPCVNLVGPASQPAKLALSGGSFSGLSTSPPTSALPTKLVKVHSVLSSLSHTIYVKYLSKIKAQL